MRKAAAAAAAAALQNNQMVSLESPMVNICIDKISYNSTFLYEFSKF